MQISRFFKAVQNLIYSNDGVCISTSYEGAKYKLKVVCSSGHLFEESYHNIQRGIWCKICKPFITTKKSSIEEINNKWRSINIKCISINYIGNKSKLKWQCTICNNIIEKTKNDMDRYFTTCKICKYNEQFELAKEKAYEKGGRITSNYVGPLTKLMCLCKNNHEFSIRPHNLFAGNWCKKCSQNSYISENICRAYFEQMFGESFDSIRPDWLKKDNNWNLELDGYCANINLAFEHQGTQHYENVFNKPEKEFQESLNNDLLKLKFCKENNINIIIIPSLFKKTPISDLRSLIINKCKDLSINIPFLNIKIDLSKCYDDNRFNYYKKLAKEHGGRCLSEYYMGSVNEKLIWECKEKHIWKQLPYVIKNSWCPTCSSQLHSKNIIK